MVKITVSLNGGKAQNGRQVVQTSGGVVYVLYTDSTSGLQTISKLVGGVFTDQDNAGRPGSGSSINPGCAIDSTDLIHVVWFDNDPPNSGVRYATFNTGNDTWTGNNEQIELLGGSSGIANPQINVVIDVNDKPHVAYKNVENTTNFELINYSNRISGSWKTPVNVFNTGSTAQAVFSVVITIGIPTNAIGSDVPIVAFRSTSSQNRVHHGDTLDATSFSTSFAFSGGVGISIATDVDNFVHLAHKSTTGQLRYRTHDPADVWGTWTDALVDAQAYKNTVSIAVLSVTDNKNIYIFGTTQAGADDDNILLHSSIEGGAFSKQTLNVAGGGEFFDDNTVKWSKRNNNTPTALDYLFRNPNNADIFYDTFTAVIPSVTHTFSIDAKLFFTSIGNVTVDNDADPLGNRNNVRTSNDRAYVIAFEEVSAGVFEVAVWKGNQDGEPTAFTRVGNHSTQGTPAGLLGCSAYIDATDRIHIFYYDVDRSGAMGAVKQVRYDRFDTMTDTFDITSEVVATIDDADGTVDFRHAVALDVNGDPHAVWIDSTTDMGANKDTVYYANRIAGSWNARVIVQQATDANGVASMVDLIVDEPTSAIGTDRPLVFIEINDAQGGGPELNAFHGTTLNATAFTSSLDITGAIVPEDDTGGFFNAQFSVAIDSNKKIVLTFIEDTTRDLMVVEHLASNNWATWQTPADVDTSRDYLFPRIAINGTFRYIYVQSTADTTIRLWRDEGAGFVEETADPDLPNVGLFFQTSAKWQNRFNNSPRDLDYLFIGTANDMLYNTFQGSLFPTDHTFTVDAIVKVENSITFTADARLLRTPNFEFTVDANIKFQTVSTDGIVFKEKNTFRTVGDVPYILYKDLNLTGDPLAVTKLVSNVWTIQDGANGPTPVNQVYSGAIDSTGKIHVAWFDFSTTFNDLTYQVFDTVTDLWVGVKETITVRTSTSGFSFNQIAIDANDIPHIVYNVITSGSGGQKHVFYKNRIGGSWNTEVAVATDADRSGIDLIIGSPTNAIGADRPIILGTSDSPREVEFFHGNALNATSFVGSGDQFLTQGPTDGGVRFAQDVKDFIHVAFGASTIQELFYSFHDPADSWSTWATPLSVDTDDPFREVNITVLPNGVSQPTGVYIFGRPIGGVNDGDLLVWIDKGSGFVRRELNSGAGLVSGINDNSVRGSKYGFNFPFTLDYNFHEATSPVFYAKLEADPNFNFTVDAVTVGEIKSTIFSLDALLTGTTDNNFTVDALAQIMPSIMWTNDALLLAIQTNTFTINVRIKAIQTNTFSIDAIVFAINDNAFTVDAFIQAVNTDQDFIIDANVQLATSNNFAVDALLLATQTNTFIVDARLSALNEFTIDGCLVGIQTTAFTIDVRILATQTTTFTVDARIKEIQTFDFTVDACLQTIQTNVFTVDGLAFIMPVSLICVDGLLQELNQTLAFTVDAKVVNVNTNTFTVDATVVNRNTTTLSVDAILVNRNTTVFTVDADLQELDKTFDFIVDANVQVATTINFAVDVFIQAIQTDTFSVNAILRLIQITTFTVNAIIKTTQTNDFIVNAIVVDRNQVVFGVDASIAQQKILEFTANAQIIKATQFSVDAILRAPSGEFVFSDVHLQDVAHLFEPPKTEFTVNARIKAIQDNEFTVNAVIVRRTEFTVNARIKAIQTETFLVDGLAQIMPSIMWNNDALLQATKTLDFTADARIKVTPTNDFTVDGLLRATQTNEFTVDAQLNKVHEFTVDGLTKGTVTFDFIVDVNIELAKTLDFTVGAKLRFVTDHTFAVDAFVRARQINEFIVDANLTGILRFTVDARIVPRHQFTVDARVVPVNIFTVDAFVQQLNINQDFIVDANVEVANSKSFSLDALLELQTDHTFTVDALAFIMPVSPICVDAVLVEITAEIDIQLLTFQTPTQPAVFFDVDAIIVQRNDQTFQVDAQIIRGINFNFSVDAVLSAIQDNDFTVDAFLAIFARLVHTSIIRENLKVTSVIRRRSP